MEGGEKTKEGGGENTYPKRRKESGDGSNYRKLLDFNF